MTQIISIHALRMEGDIQTSTRDIIDGQFLSTPSAWRATYNQDVIIVFEDDFYPRPPHGGRQIPFIEFCNNDKISIHALRMEGDCGIPLTVL